MPYKCLRILILLCSLSCSFVHGEEIHKRLQDGFAEGITVDLRDPLYDNGILTSDKGGVVSGSDLRIQAQKIRYTRKLVEGQPVFTIEAEDQLTLEFGEYMFVGDKLFYDFQKKEGTIYKGITSNGPWFFGGEKIELKSDKSYIIHDGYVTTSENMNPDWQIFSKKAHIFVNHCMQAHGVQFKLFDFSLIWIPSMKLNLDMIFDSPIRYRFKWGGKQGPRFGLTYELLSWEGWKTFVRFDYRLTRGPGGGIEMYYHSPDHTTHFESINYFSKDSSLLNPHEKFNYRFEGIFNKKMDQGKTTIQLTYDKISDLNMPSTYYDRDFDFETSNRTQFFVRRQEDNWISTFNTRVRINNFQTVKEELPSFGVNFRPYAIRSTGIIFENEVQASYVQFKYANNIAHVKNYSSSRFDYRPNLYRPIGIGPFTLTPHAGAVAIFYGDSPEKESQFLSLSILGYDLSTQLYRTQDYWKHVIEPYISYNLYTQPTSLPCRHYIFDINDGWYRLNRLTFGIKNSLYEKSLERSVSRTFFADIYAHAFYDSKHISPTIPKIYANLFFFTSPTLRHTLESAWDFRSKSLSYFNFRLDWTLNPNFAFSTEFRYRNPYAWRKADYDNFFVDAYHSEDALHHSAMSDQRNTLLFHTFYRFHPNWAIEVSSRQGWNRLREPNYTEYEVDLLTTIQTAWHLRFSFQHQENDNRIAIYVNVGLKPPVSKSVTPSRYIFE